MKCARFLKTLSVFKFVCNEEESLVDSVREFVIVAFLFIDVQIFIVGGCFIEKKVISVQTAYIEKNPIVHIKMLRSKIIKLLSITYGYKRICIRFFCRKFCIFLF